MRLGPAAVLFLVGSVACTGAPGARVRRASGDPDLGRAPTAADRQRGRGAAPGDERGPGGFVPRGDARCFYSAGGGRLWYYLNTYYWAPTGLDTKDLWIKAEVVERFADLHRWDDAGPVPVDPQKHPRPKRTVEYWLVGASGRAVTLDNHKDFCLLADDLCQGAIEVQAVLALGRLRVRGADGSWVAASQPYVLECRDYGDGRGIGAERAHFTPLPDEPVTVWAYRVPWSSLPGRMTRSAWEGLRVPTWSLVERCAPGSPASPGAPPDRPVVTTSD